MRSPWGAGGASAVAVVVAGSVFLGASSSNLVPEPGTRMVLSETGLAALDRGLLDNDAPAGPRGTGRKLSIAGADSSRPYVPGRVIVKFRDGVSPGAQQALAGMVSARSVEKPDFADFHLLVLDPSADPEEVARKLTLVPEVEYAQAAYRWRAYFKPNDPLYSRQWNLTSALDMERAWDINPGASSSIVVAVLDGGVAYRDAVVRYGPSRSFFAGGAVYPSIGPVNIPFAVAPELGASRFVAPRDFIWNDNAPFDLDGHGTHVAGTIGQLTNNGLGVAGVAFSVRIMPVKVISEIWDEIFGSPFSGTDDTVARGIRYAVDNGAKVINMSIGRNGPPAPAVESAMREAVSRGVFIAVAGGNSFEDGSPVEVLAEIASRVNGAVAVAAVGQSLRRAYYSSAGSWIEISAPGGDFFDGGVQGLVLQQTYDSTVVQTYLLPPSRYGPPRFDVLAYVYYQGTSMASPHVAGLAALLMQQGITDPAAIEAAMEKFAKDLGSPGRDSEYGYGLINPRATLRGLGLTAP